VEFLVNLFVKTDGKQLRCSFICILMNYPAAEDRLWDAVVARTACRWQSTRCEARGPRWPADLERYTADERRVTAGLYTGPIDPDVYKSRLHLLD
jgi:hypothetical protein